ncbi:MAG: dihydroneopterin aldolase [Bacteroidales bacterium]|nr:dihydroneopterin aldolase [Bacteroidales bacterium]
MGLIQIEGMEFFAYHGCFKEERVIGTRFIVDIAIEADTKEAEVTDDLKKTVNYQSVYKIIKAEMAEKSHLLEHVGRRIIRSIHTYHPEARHIKVKIMKLNPALAEGGKIKHVSVTLEG